jgi:hypothetical protein
VSKSKTSKIAKKSPTVDKAVASSPVETAPAQELIAKSKATPAAASATKQPRDRASAPAKAKRSPREGPSGLAAAHSVLLKAGKAMNVRDITDAVLSRKLWTTSGRTPSATIAAAIMREIKLKGDGSRFMRAGRGLFEARPSEAGQRPKAPSSKSTRSKVAAPASK